MTAKKKKTTKKTTAKKIKLTFAPIASGAKQISFRLKTMKHENRDGRDVEVSAPLIKGLPQILTVKKNEIIEVTKAQYDELSKLGFVETNEEYEKRKLFIDNLENQHPNKLSFEEMSGISSNQLTMKDSQHVVYMDKLSRV